MPGRYRRTILGHCAPIVIVLGMNHRIVMPAGIQSPTGITVRGRKEQG
jgi:hypothetical protein